MVSLGQRAKNCGLESARVGNDNKLLRFLLKCWQDQWQCQVSAAYVGARATGGSGNYCRVPQQQRGNGMGQVSQPGLVSEGQLDRRWEGEPEISFPLPLKARQV